MRLFLWTLFCALLTGALHFSDGNLTQRDFINYDDLQLVAPITKMTVSEYFSNWLPDRNHHAYPLRDLTLIADAKLSQWLGFKIYWWTQWLWFCALLFAVAALLKELKLKNPWLVYLGIAIFALHPAQLEFIQWITIRKHLMATLFIVWGTVFVMHKKDSPWRAWDWLVIWALYLASLACFPTGLMWLPWVLWWKKDQWINHSRAKWAIPSLTVACIFSYMKLTTSGEADYGPAMMRLLLGEKVDQTLFYAYLSSVRGLANTFFPWQLATFYREDHPLNLLGIALLLGTVFLLRKAARSSSRWPQIKSLTLGTLLLLMPSALVFVLFPDFVWADRYVAVALPFIVGLMVLALDHLRFTRHFRVITSLLALTWLSLSSFTIIKRTPLWRDAIVLMNECAENERSPKCVIQTLLRVIHKDGCAPYADEIKLGRELFAQKLPRYGSEFRSDMPFYDAICIALAKNKPSEQKLKELPYLFDHYEGAGEIMFSIILAEIEAGDVRSAWRDAKSYYLSGDTRPIITSRNNINIFWGHIPELCRILSSENQSECIQRQKIFENAHAKTLPDRGYRWWGAEITKLMHQRSLSPGSR